MEQFDPPPYILIIDAWAIYIRNPNLGPILGSKPKPLSDDQRFWNDLRVSNNQGALLYRFKGAFTGSLREAYGVLGESFFMGPPLGFPNNMIQNDSSP